MSITNAQQLWQPPAHLSAIKYPHQYDERGRRSARSHTPSIMEAAIEVDSAAVQHDGEYNVEDDAQRALFRSLYERSEAKIASLFRGELDEDELIDEGFDNGDAEFAIEPPIGGPPKSAGPKKTARAIDEDNYDDDDEEDEDEDEAIANESPLKRKSANALLSPSKSGSSPLQGESSPTKQADKAKTKKPPEQPKTVEDARKQLEEAKKATEEAAKRSFHTMYYTLENDRVAMLEQQQLEESEKQIDAEMSNGGNANSANGAGVNGQHGTLSSANLGASSLTLKHLIARIDLKRDQVQASDAELRHLMNEVRKNRSKWASEENVHQEELYEAAEKVLSELKAMTEYSAPFLTRVNKREAPDYYNIISKPMDLGSMTKKLKTLQYKSKTEFVADLDLIWSNCLKYNGDMSHPLRRNANSMRKEAEKLVPLIPDLAIRPRAEVEAEERRKQNGVEDDGGDESDDEPIMSSRGRKAPGKTGAKGATKHRGSVSGGKDSTPGAEQKPTLQLNGLLAREGSETAMEGSQNGFSTPPVGGSITPSLMNGLPGMGSHADAMDIDGPSINGISLGHALGAAADDLLEDEEYKIWKQVTKKDRALVAKERNQLFKGEKLNPDEPALLRTRAGMRRWLCQQKQAIGDGAAGESNTTEAARNSKDTPQAAETLAEGMETVEERVIPDYYDPLSGIPDVPEKLQWVEDSQGQVINQSGEFLRLVPPGHFTAPQSALTNRIYSNMQQMKETRKLCSKIGVIKQMQLQSQMYNNQFQKYDPEPFFEADIEPHYKSDDGAIMSPWVCRAALQRSVGELCYHAGFEELQPSALDTITDIASDFFTKVAQSFNVYREAPKILAAGAAVVGETRWQQRFSNEETVLHCLNENGQDIEELQSYAKDDLDRLGTKLTVMHERMRAHLTDLLRPALADAGPDGAGAFNDGSEQFVGGDFAEDLDEDFFGFKELGLDREFGMSTLSVPLHLLQSKMHSQYQAQNLSASIATSAIFAELPPLAAVTRENIHNEIGLIKNFFLAKLHANSDEPLIEDEALPLKQRFPKPRLPPTGKITSPRKRPLKEQAINAKKKKKLESGLAQELGGGSGGNGGAGANPGGGKPGGAVNGSPEKPNGSAALTASAKKAKAGLPNGGPVGMERAESSQGNASQTEKDDVSAVGMMSPESIER